MQPASARLPAHLIVLFDSLSNVDFMSLTKRSLKDKVENLKNAVAAELAKHSQSNSSKRPDSQDIRGPAPTATPDPLKSVPKPAGRNGDRVPDRGRDGDRSVGTRLLPAAKNSGLKSAAPAVPPPPKFSDLIRLAADRRQDGGRDTKSPSPVRNKNRRLSPDPRSRSGHRSPESRTEYRSRPIDDRWSANSRPDRSDRRSDVAGNQQSRGRGSSYENGTSQRHAVRVPAHSANASSRPAQRADDSRNGEKDNQNRQRTEEKRPSAKMRKKNEEEQILERRKQRIREEEARVKLRNDVLSGKKSSADLKTLVTKSMGSTVLSCGRPAVPDSSNRQRDNYRNSHADGHAPVRGSGIPVRHANDRIRSGDRQRRPPDRYYDDYDDEDEEEMDDFIDDDNNFDNDDDNPDVSQHIREIFGYDKRKYADFDDEDIPESSYAEVQKEEMRSAKIGRKEDLEDMRMELIKKKEKRKHMVRD